MGAFSLSIGLACQVARPGRPVSLVIPAFQPASAVEKFAKAPAPRYSKVRASAISLKPTSLQQNHRPGRVGGRAGHSQSDPKKTKNAQGHICGRYPILDKSDSDQPNAPDTETPASTSVAGISVGLDSSGGSSTGFESRIIPSFRQAPHRATHGCRPFAPRDVTKGSTSQSGAVCGSESGHSTLSTATQVRSAMTVQIIMRGADPHVHALPAARLTT